MKYIIIKFKKKNVTFDEVLKSNLDVRKRNYEYSVVSLVYAREHLLCMVLYYCFHLAIKL